MNVTILRYWSRFLLKGLSSQYSVSFTQLRISTSLIIPVLQYLQVVKFIAPAHSMNKAWLTFLSHMRPSPHHNWLQYLSSVCSTGGKIALPNLNEEDLFKTIAHREEKTKLSLNSVHWNKGQESFLVLGWATGKVLEDVRGQVDQQDVASTISYSWVCKYFCLWLCPLCLLIGAAQGS